jgi:hypothetical protein
MLLPTSTSSAKFGSTGDLALHKTSTDTLNALGGSRVETSEVTELRHALELNLSQARNNTDEVSDKSELIGIIDEYLSSFGLPNREKVCEILAQRLSTFWKEHHDPLALRACIKVKTEMLTLYPAGHPKRDGLCGGLAVLLKAVHKQTRDRALLDRAIELEREALHLRPLGHPSRAVTGANLAVSLKTCYDQTGDRILLDQAIELERQVLDLRPSGHPKRDISCCNLAITLKKIYDQVKDDSTLDQAIELQREALDLHPRGHPKRSMSCGNLADFLKARHEKTGESVLLDQVIELEQEALALRPAGHPGRGISCSNLAISLKTRYKHTGNSSLLDQAVELEREALDLYSTDDPIRSILCGQLADSLSTRYKQTGDLALLDEAITLGRESLDLHPAGRPKRGMLCSNLAVLLITRYEQTGDSSLFDQAIALEREVVELHPPGNPGRAIACSNHAITLRTRYKQTGNSMLLDQAVKLHKEALDLCPVGHPDRAMSCHNLASTLMTDFDQKEDRILLDQAIELETEALLLTTEEHPARWQFLCAMAQLTELLPPPLDQETIIGHLYQVFNASAYDDISLVLSSAGGTLLKIDASVLSLQQRPTLMKLYTRALDIVSLAAGLALDISTQLRHISNGNALSLAAFRLSVQLDDISRGLSLLERTRGVIWSQILHMRNPELDQVPEDLSERLQGLLRSAPGSGPGSQAKEVQRLLVSRERDMDYGKRSSIQDVIRQIRSLPELGEFMRGPDAEILLSMGNHNPIVVLIADEKESHALLIMSDHVLSHMLMPDVTQHMLKDLTFESLTSQKRGSEPLGLDSTDRGLNIAKGSSPPHSRLARLWRLIVKPIIKRIGLEVCEVTKIHTAPELTEVFRKHKGAIAQGSIGVQPVLSRSCPYTQQGSTKARTRSAVLIMSSRRTHQR